MSVQQVSSPGVPDRVVQQVRTHPAPVGGQSKNTESGPRETVPAAGDLLTSGERDFFEQLFPGSTSEIRSHQAYARSGAIPEGKTGGIFDRKG
jgi:hypothetical protein